MLFRNQIQNNLDYMVDWLIDRLVLTACQPFLGYLYQEVRESCSLYIHIYIFYVVIS